jgi:site-specific DNA-cytosine methylase
VKDISKDTMAHGGLSTLVVYSSKELKKGGNDVNVLSLFDGISCGQLALERAGIDVNNYYASEIDKYAVQVALKNFPNTISLGDVKNVTAKDLKHISLLIGGSPCQGFSRANDGRLNFNDDRSQLVLEYIRLFEELNPKFFLLENVVMDKFCEDYISERLGVEPVLINSDRFIQQNRPRLYWTNIPIAELPERPDWNIQYAQFRRYYWRENKNGVCPCLTANMGTGGNNVPYIIEKGEKRVLNIEELEELQTLPKGYTEGISNTQRKKCIGNGWTVDVIAHILRNIKQ